MKLTIDKCFSCYYSCMKRMPVDSPCFKCKYAEYKKDQKSTLLKSKYKIHPGIKMAWKIANNINNMVWIVKGNRNANK